MNVQLHPDIDSLDKESLCYSIYSQLYHNFSMPSRKRMMTILTVSRKGTRPA